MNGLDQTRPPGALSDTVFHVFFVLPFVGAILLLQAAIVCIGVHALIPSVWLDPQLRPDTFRFWIFMAILVAAVLAVCSHVGWMLAYNTRIDDKRVVLRMPARGVDQKQRVLFVIAALYLGFAIAAQNIRPSAWLPWSAVAAIGLALYLDMAAAPLGIEYRRLNWDEWYFFRSDDQARRQMVLQQHYPGGEVQEAVLAPRKARVTFADLHGMEQLKTRLLEAGKPVFAGRKGAGTPGRGKKGAAEEAAPAASPRNGILLFGDPGNGKTFVAEALAGELGVGFVTLDYGKVVSKFVGDTPQRISRAFADAKMAAPCVLFIDEIDSFIVDRDAGRHNTQESESIVNLLLTELVNIREHPVLVMAATNRLNKLDGAAIREGRFDFKIEVPPPDAPARIALLTSSLDRSLAGAAIERVDLDAVRSAAQRWEGFSVKRIQAVGEEMPAYLRQNPTNVVGYEQLMGALRSIQGRKGKLPADAKGLADLVLPAATADALQLIARRIADPLRVESMGGTLPAGVLFHGPAGTGKTAVARALAKDTGWAFLSVAGPDLLKNVDELEKVYQQACELRPAIIFIDEADDILRDRQFSQAGAITNKMLTVLDGAGGKIKDVLFIAATNNPDQIDPAMLRAGRFTEKVPFFAASAETAPMIIERWLTRKSATLAQGVTLARVSKLLDGQSPANIEGVLQYALNLAIDATLGNDPSHVAITLDQVARALDVVAPEA